MSYKPSVLFASCTNYSPSKLIELVLGEPPIATENKEGIFFYPYHINTKYYEADIHLGAMQSKILTTPEFADSVHGLVLYFDFDKFNCLSLINDWSSVVKQYHAEIKILVCSVCKDNSAKDRATKHEVLEWCLRENFELVELYPITDDEPGSELDFHETTGVKRIIQALEAHVWPNIVLKEHKEPTSMSGLLHGGHCKSTESDFESNSFNSHEDYIEPSLEDITSNENIEFCELFSRFVSMKERASNMPSEERKAYAEQLVLAYYSALGGDSEQILDC